MLGPLRLPLRLAAGVTEVALRLTLDALSGLRRALEGEELPPPAPRPRPQRRRPSSRPPRPTPPRDSTAERGAPPPDGPAPAPAEPPSAAAMPVPDEAKTLDDEPDLVGEFGEAGAEEQAGAEVTVDEPWPGYERMNVKAIEDRLTAASRELLAAVVLYEGWNKKRASVRRAAERRLRQLSPPSPS